MGLLRGAGGRRRPGLGGSTSLVSLSTAASGGTRAHLAATVQMFSFTKYDPIANRLTVRSAVDPWSPAISVDTVGTVGEIGVQTLDGPAQLGMSIKLGSSKMKSIENNTALGCRLFADTTLGRARTFARARARFPPPPPLDMSLLAGDHAYVRTKLVTFAPRFVVINRSPWMLEVEQCNDKGASRARMDPCRLAVRPMALNGGAAAVLPGLAEQEHRCVPLPGAAPAARACASYPGSGHRRRRPDRRATLKWPA